MIWKRLRRLLIVLLALVLLVASGLAGYATYALYFNPIPTTRGSVTVEGIAASVRIYRDNWGIAHIYATTSEDLFFAQGYVHAQDRWWQMELSRLIGTGNIHKIAGNHEEYLRLDRFIKTVGWEETARREWENASPETRTALEAYTRGVNAYIHERSTEDLAAEYGLLSLSGQYDSLFTLIGQDVPVAAWEPFHSLLWFQIFDWSLSSSLWSELERARLYEKLGVTLTDAYLPLINADSQLISLSLNELGLTGEAHPTTFTYPPAIPPEVELTPATNPALHTPLVGEATQSFLEQLGFQTGIGAGVWVVAGNHTESGKPLLANDFHHRFEIPSAWFEMSLHCVSISPDCPYNVTGMTAPGLPGILVGHNDQIAWGISNLPADTQDLYLVRLNPANLFQYEFDGQWVNLESATAIISRSGDTTLEQPIYQTRFGPIISDLNAVDANHPQALVLRSVRAYYSGDTIRAMLAMNRAQNWADFRQALTAWHSPAMNFFYADIEGNIGYQAAGTFIIRDGDHSGLVPAPGWIDKYEWQGIIPYGYLPSVYNPPDGILYNTNNALVPTAYYNNLSAKIIAETPDKFSETSDINVVFTQEWAPDFRARRLDSLLKSIKLHTPDSFALIQSDTHNLFAESLLPLIFALDFDDATYTDMRDWLKEWNLQTDMSNAQAALFITLWGEIVRLTFADELGYQSSGSDRIFWAVHQLLATPDHALWDNVDTSLEVETRDTILKQALIDAQNFLEDYFDSDRETWRWGDLHSGTFVSRLLGEEGFLNIEPVVDSGPFPLNRGPYPISGDAITLNTSTFSVITEDTDMPYAALTGPSYRIILDLADFNRSRAMHMTGQSGHPASEHYEDMIIPWQTVEYHNMYWDTTRLTQGDTKLLELVPR